MLFLRQFSSDFCNSRFILKRNVFATEVYCQIWLFSKCIYDHFFLYIFRKNEKKNRMYCLYESINEHNADIDFFAHALAMFWDQNQKNRSEIDDVITNNTSKFGHRTQKMSITSKIPEILKIPYKQKCLRIRYYTQYWNFRSIEWLVNMWTHKVHAPLKHTWVLGWSGGGTPNTKPNFVEGE